MRLGISESFKSDWACRKTYYKMTKLAGVVAQGETTTDNGSAQGGLRVAILITYLVPMVEFL